MTECKWWIDERRPYRLVNGVFKGGGARGVAYGGALCATAGQRIWFDSVAGASAGAITATLIASGVHPLRLGEMSRQALPKVLKPALHRPSAGALLSTKALRIWLEGAIREELGIESSESDVTFARLFKATDIGLYVIVMDLATRGPLVLCHELAGDIAVSHAVASSCAIPSVLSPGRSILLSEGAPEIHRFVDGGAWANYPSFVFDDPDFLAWLAAHRRDNMKSIDDSLPTIGYVLNDPVDQDPPDIKSFVEGNAGSPRYDLGPGETSGRPTSFLVGSVLGGVSGRIALLLVFATWIVMTVLALPHLWRRVDVWSQGLWPPLQPLPVFGLTVAILVGLLVVTALLFVLFVAGHVLVRTLLPSTFAALSPATSVAPWIGANEKNLVVPVPTGRFKTFSFWRKEEDITAIRRAAWRAVRPRIRAWKEGRPLPPLEGIKLEKRVMGTRPRIWMIVIGSVLVAGAAVLTVAIFLYASTDPNGDTVGSAISNLVLGVFLLVIFGRIAARAQRTRARDRLSMPARAITWMCAVLGAVLVCASIGAAIWGEAADSVIVRVDSATQTVPPARIVRYTGSIDQPAHLLGSQLSFMSEQRLTVGTQVRLLPETNPRDPADEWEPQLATFDRFLSIGLLVAGVMLLSSAAKQRAWDRGNAKIRERLEMAPSNALTSVPSHN